MAIASAQKSLPPVANDTDDQNQQNVRMISQELFIGLVGYAGAGCSGVKDLLTELFQDHDYEVIPIKVSDLIANAQTSVEIPEVGTGADRHQQKFARAKALQDAGDKLREEYGGAATAILSIKEIKEKRGARAAGESRIVYIIDSLKHSEEAELLRHTYEKSFRLLAVHCNREDREKRLIGDPPNTRGKFFGVSKSEITQFLDRDEKDSSAKGTGQEVRDVFYKADFFLANNGSRLNRDALRGPVDRFIQLLFGIGVPTPTPEETAMYMAFASSLSSSCLSRKVGATLIGEHGDIISQGYNEVPKFGGGVYRQGQTPDNRCMHFDFINGEQESWKGCHNARKKKELKENIAQWIADEFTKDLALAAHPASETPVAEMDVASTAREAAEAKISELLTASANRLKKMPGVGDLIEYSRSIHAEMSALFNAARAGNSTQNSTLACTTFPCHNCARHLVTAGVKEVLYVEPYVKSAALELHSDAITTKKDEEGKMKVLPFTGIGPIMYKDHFEKHREVKESDGKLKAETEDSSLPVVGAPIRDLTSIEDKAAQLI